MASSWTIDREMHTLAPAKLNLCLRVVGRRDDGRHLLESLFWPVDLCDELAFSEAESPSMQLQWADDAPRTAPIATDGTNLVLRAMATAGRSAAVVLTKRIPAEAGLGGGSSDAAAVLRVLCPAEKRFSAALSLGADVPFFLDPRPGWMTGIGEVRSDWEAGALEAGFVIAVPPFSLATARVFDHFRQNGALGSVSIRPPLRPTLGELGVFLATHGNILEASALSLEPRLGPVLRALADKSPVHSGMSGSGTVCFAMFETLAIAREKAQVLAEEFRSLNCRWIAVANYSGEHHGNHRGESLPGQRR